MGESALGGTKLVTTITVGLALLATDSANVPNR
jgi:hypothetical protein